jgi:hypothetical protein
MISVDRSLYRLYQAEGRSFRKMLYSAGFCIDGIVLTDIDFYLGTWGTINIRANLYKA